MTEEIVRLNNTLKYHQKRKEQWQKNYVRAKRKHMYDVCDTCKQGITTESSIIAQLNWKLNRIKAN